MPSGQPGAPPTAAVPSASGNAPPMTPPAPPPPTAAAPPPAPTAAVPSAPPVATAAAPAAPTAAAVPSAPGNAPPTTPSAPVPSAAPSPPPPNRTAGGDGHSASSYAATERATGGSRDVGGRSPAGSRSAASLGLLQRACRRHLRATDPRSHPPLPTGHPVRRDWLPHGGPGQPLGYASMKQGADAPPREVSAAPGGWTRPTGPSPTRPGCPSAPSPTP